MTQQALLSPARGQFVSTVAANIPLCREHFRLVLRLASFPPTRPGQFVQVACVDAGVAPDSDAVTWEDATPPQLSGCELTERTAVLRRPFSLAGRRELADGGVELELIHRVVGAGTDWLSRLEMGDPVNLIGPLGNAFTLPDNGEAALLVGGGVGIPPMMYLASLLVDRPAIAFCGAVTRDLLALTVISDGIATNRPPLPGQMVIGEFARYGVQSVISTDDGSLGYRGYVTQALEHYLDHHHGAGGTGPRPTIYTCGPELMMKRIADIAAARGLPVQIAVERAMACGMGTCQSCVIKVKTGPDAWRYRLACTDGPVFAGADLIW